MVSRARVVQTFLDLRTRARYLEIGVYEGQTFNQIKANSKVAVDPAFKFKLEELAPQENVKYHQVTSDVYFDSLDPSHTFDVIFLDGLHTFEQTLRDLLNAICFLEPGGVIVVDDVLPNSYAASLPGLNFYLAFWKAAGSGNPQWMGDVYKLVFFVRDYMPQFSYATVEDNHGQLVLWKQQRRTAKSTSPLQIEDIARLDFGRLILAKEAYNLMPLASIAALVRSFAQDAQPA